MEAGTSSSKEVADFLGVKIENVDLPKNINGFWAKTASGAKIIFINNELKDWQKSAVVAHEIGHITMHPEYVHYCMSNRTWYAKTRKEDEADSFAVELCRQCFDCSDYDVEGFLKYSWQECSYRA